MKTPLILISSGRFMDTLSIFRRQSELYTTCLSAAGGTGVIHSGASTAALAARCDGLLLAGGGDIHPARYGQTCACKQLSIDCIRDEEEQALFDAFFARSKPILGICRGMQAINVLSRRYVAATRHRSRQLLPYPPMFPAGLPNRSARPQRSTAITTRSWNELQTI